MSETVIQVTSLGKRIKGKTILEDISFEIKQGDCVALIGPNGAGKTVLMSCILGDKKHSSGQVLIEGKWNSVNILDTFWENSKIFGRRQRIYVSQKDMLEICQDGDKYFLRYPTFNITCPEVIREIPKEAADSYMSGEHTGKELMNYAQYGFWKSKKEYTQDESDKLFIEDHPSFILKNPENSRCLFTAEEFRQIVTQAISSELKPTELDAIGTVDNHLELLLVDSVDWEEEIEAVHLEILQEKINNYIHFLESKQYVERYGDSFDKKVIHITFQYSPSDNGLAFLAAVQKVLQPTDMSLKLELPE